MNTNCSLSVVTDENQNLVINFSEALGYECVVKLTPWTHGVSWSSSAKDASIETLEEMGVPFSILVSTVGTYQWLSTFPVGILNNILKYEKKFHGTTYGLVWCLSRSTSACELFLDSPVLAWLIIISASKLQWDAEYTLSLFSKKRTVIIEESGLTNSKAVLNLLLKCQFACFGLHEYQLITRPNLLTSSKHLSHLPYIDERLLKLIVRFPQFKTSNLINQFGQNWSWDHFDQSFDDTMNMGEQLGIPKILSLILACNNLHSLKQLHDKLAVKINEKECSNTPLIYYTVPPVRGNEFIIPITNNHALMNEGAVQHNCVVSYHNRIILGKYYVYKILKPERATLGLKLKEGEFHSIDQIKLCFNSDVSKKTLEQVEEWLIMSKIVI
tara:strand:+ start:7352 stop:8506 length:1155 start_codon:yes stop_codon:yes gene_type:complete